MAARGEGADEFGGIRLEIAVPLRLRELPGILIQLSSPESIDGVAFQVIQH
jgi:hypothetical protein